MAGRDAQQLTETALAASRAILGVVARSLAEALDQVTLPQFRVLVVLDTRGPQRTGALADAVGVHQSTFTRTADRLVRNGWVERVDNPDSRREVVVRLTPTGRELVRGVMSHRRTELRAILRKIPTEQRRCVLDGLHAFAEAAGEATPEDLLTLGL